MGYVSEYQSVDVCADAVIKELGNRIVLGLPLGLGKPNQFVNALYKKVKANPGMHLKIFTALSLEVPKGHSDLEKRFLKPFTDRVFGGYEELEYMIDLRRNKIPDNVEVCEFYFKSGSMMNTPYAQQHYISTNYTHVARDLIDHGVNLIAQLISHQEIEGKEWFSLSCNTDVTLDLLPMVREQQSKGKKILFIGQVHEELPFMGHRALIEPNQFDMIIRNPKYNSRLFATPNMSVSAEDYIIGLHASSLIKDGGTLQIGIGALGDAIVYCCQLRHEHNEVYRKILDEVTRDEHQKDWVNLIGGVDGFTEGLYGSSEMFVNGFLHLMNSGILKREVVDHLGLQTLINDKRISHEIRIEDLDELIEAELIQPQLRQEDVTFLEYWGYFHPNVKLQEGELVFQGLRTKADLNEKATLAWIKEHCLGSRIKHGVFMLGAFYLGPESFYKALQEMSEELKDKICMSSVGHVNQLFGDVPLEVAQRKDARFINTGIIATLSGAVVSDGLDNGKVISGVGGQFNFVTMAHSLPGARSILCIRAVRDHEGEVRSNIVYDYGHITVPRHMRDIIITEYGIADLRGKTDMEVYKSLLNIADSRFQEELLEEAKANKKLPEDYKIPKAYRNNTPKRLEKVLDEFKEQGYFDPFPLGSDFTDEEIVLGKCLKRIKAKIDERSGLVGLARSLMDVVSNPPVEAIPYLKRMELNRVHSFREIIYQKLIVEELREIGII